MKQIKYISQLTILLLACSSCIKDIDLEHLRPDPKLVLNSVTTVNEPVKAAVSRTWFYTEDHPNVTLKDAEVNLYVNDQFRERLQWEEGTNKNNFKGRYVSSYVLSPDDKIRLEAKADGFKDVYAENVTPPKPVLKKIAIDDIFRKNEWGNTSHDRVYKVTISDHPEPDNCYLVRVVLKTPESKWVWGEDGEDPTIEYTGEYHYSRPSIDYTEEPIFGDKISIMDKLMGNDWLSEGEGRPFSDELFNGKEYTLKLVENSYGGSYPTYPPDPSEPEAPPSYCTVYLYSISESYYKYLASLSEIDDLSFGNDLIDAGLAEPIKIFSNVKGGVGIVGTACVDSLTIEMPVVKTQY